VNSQTPNPRLASSRLLARNSLWNLFGQVLPMVAGVVVVPRLLRGLGIDRFGLLSLAWILVGYFSLLDLASGRALTKFVSEKLALDEHHAIPALAWTSLLLMSALGLFAGTLLFAISPTLVHRLLNIPANLKPEALRSFYLLALSVPFVTVTSGLRGLLEATQNFRVTNLIRIPLSVFSFVGPLMVLPFSHSLIAITAVLLAARFIAAAAYLIACLRILPVLRRQIVVDGSFLPPFLKFSGWMSVTNLASPLLFYLDRFVIGAVLSISAVAYYSTPFDVVTRLWIIPWSIGGVLFPAFALTVSQDANRTKLLFVRGTKYVFIVMFPVLLTIILFAPEALRWWLGQSFANNATPILRLLAAGVFVNSLTFLPFTLLQSCDRPDIPAKIHFLELPISIVLLITFVRADGIKGAALVWLARILFEFLLFFAFSCRLLPQPPRFLLRLGIGTSCALLGFYAATLPNTLFIKLGFICVTLFAFTFVIFRYLSPEERRFILL
jgi:O-antigen/teichoic acid export membrane protein